MPLPTLSSDNIKTNVIPAMDLNSLEYYLRRSQFARESFIDYYQNHYNEPEEILQCISHGVWNIRDAAKYGSVSCVHFFLDRGATQDDIDEALVTAAEDGNIPIVSLLLDNAQNKEQALVIAADNGNEKLVRTLLKQGIRDPDALVLAVEAENEEIVEMLLEAGEREDFILSTAVELNNKEMVETMLKHGVREDRALTQAVEEGNSEIVEMLQDVGR